MNIISVCASALRVLRGGVDADQIARHKLEILQRERGRAIRFLRALLREQIHRSLGAAIDRIMQRHAVEAVFVRGLGGNGHLFDGAGVVVAPAGTHQRNLRRVGFAGLDEKILADANGLARLNAGDVVDAVLIHLDGAAIDVILRRR